MLENSKNGIIPWLDEIKYLTACETSRKPGL